MKKKFFALVCSLAMVFACVLLVGCGGNSTPSSNADLSGSKYVGTWVGKSATFMGEEADMGDVSEDELILTLNADGTASFTSGKDESVGNWDETGKGVKLSGKGMNMEFKDKDNGIETSVLGVDVYFEKQ